MDKIISLFKEYSWGAIWEYYEHRGIKTSDDTLIFSIIYSSWWPSATSNILPPAKSNHKNGFLYIFTFALLKLHAGFSDQIPTAVKFLIKSEKYEWMAHWLMLEMLGRSRSYEAQAAYLKNLLNKGKLKTTENWAFASIIESIRHKQFNFKYLSSVISSRNGEFSNIAGSLKNIVNGKIASDEILRERFSIYGFYINKTCHPDKLIQYYENQFECWNYQQNSLNDLLRLAISRNDSHKLLFDIRHKLQNLNLLKHVQNDHLYVYFIIENWIRKDMPALYSDATRIYTSMTSVEMHDSLRINKIFYIFILRLSMHWQNNKKNYKLNGMEKKIFIIGESHSLTLNGLVVNIANTRHVCEAKFIFGVKMFHLGVYKNPQYRQLFIERINSIGKNNKMLITIGEIDCRPSEGIWLEYSTNRSEMGIGIEKIVEEYFEFLRDILLGYGDIYIQGIPFPKYEFKGKFFVDDIDLFLWMIEYVNKNIKEKCEESGWKFVDVYNGTKSKSLKNGENTHIDTIHINPNLYLEFDELVR